MIVFCRLRKLHNSMHIAFLNISSLSIALTCQSSMSALNLYAMFVSCVICTSPTSMILINLWILDSVCNQNRLCNRQQQVKTSSKKDMFKLDLVSSSPKSFFTMPKAFSTTKWSFFMFPVIHKF